MEPHTRLGGKTPFCKWKELADVWIRRRHSPPESVLKSVARLCITLRLPGFKKRTSRKTLPRGPGDAFGKVFCLFVCYLVWLLFVVVFLDICLLFHQNHFHIKSLLHILQWACPPGPLAALGGWGC